MVLISHLLSFTRSNALLPMKPTKAGHEDPKQGPGGKREGRPPEKGKREEAH